MKEETSSNIDVTSTDEKKPNSSKAKGNPSANGSKDATSTSCDSVTVNNEAQSEGNTGIVMDRKETDTVSKESSSTSAIAAVAKSDGVSSSTDSSKMSGAGDANKTDTCPESSVASSSHGSNTVKVESSATTSATLSATVKDEASSSSNATTLPTPDDKQVSLAPTQGSAEKDKDLTAGDCQLKQLSNRTVERKKGSVFWPIGWRTKLCTCTKCKVRERIIAQVLVSLYFLSDTRYLCCKINDYFCTVMTMSFLDPTESQDEIVKESRRYAHC